MIKTITKARKVQERREALRAGMTRPVKKLVGTRKTPDGYDVPVWADIEAPAHVGEAKAVRRFRRRHGLPDLWCKAAVDMARREAHE